MLWVHIAPLSDIGLDCLQVLDDSTCKVTRQLVDEKAAEWAERGIRCDVVRRTNRQGYKAGALKDVRPSPAGHLLPLLPFGCETQSHVHATRLWFMHGEGWLASQHSIGSHKAQEIFGIRPDMRALAMQTVNPCLLKVNACAGFGSAVGL